MSSVTIPPPVKIQNGYKIRGIEPPDLNTHDAQTRLMFWEWVVQLGLKRKDQELAQGLDKDGDPLRPISAYTRKHRRSKMTPSGKGDPSAPPLTPAHQKSRTRSLLAGRAFTTHSAFFWRYDSYTGASWSVVLDAQAKHGRDVFGLSDAGLAWVKAESWAQWEQWKGGFVRKPAPTQDALPKFRRQPGEPSVVFKGREPTEAATYGIGAEGPRKGHGGRTPEEWEAYFRQTAQARPPGRPARPKSRSEQSGPDYNRMIRHTWGQPRPGSEQSPAPSRPEPGPAIPPIEGPAPRQRFPTRPAPPAPPPAIPGRLPPLTPGPRPARFSVPGQAPRLKIRRIPAPAPAPTLRQFFPAILSFWFGK